MNRHALFLLVAAVGSLSATDALAFENQWHLGAGLSAISYAGDTRYLVPALSLHGAYGLSDVFDVRLETGAGVPTTSSKSGSTLDYAEGVLAYKIDIIEWVPWIGLGAGAFAATGGLRGAARSAIQPAASFWAGMDYAFSRQWGVGLAFAIHSWMADSHRAGLRLAAEQLTLRVEHRFGW